MRIDIITIFPEIFDAFLGASMMGIAARKGIVKFRVLNLRDFTTDRHRKVDDRPYGGGPGMVFKPEPVVRAVEHATGGRPESATVVLLTPAGERLSQPLVRSLAPAEQLVIVCGHYEGFDERIRLLLKPLEISIGDFVLTGGEPAALVVVDAVVRLLPGVLGRDESLRRESFESSLLDYPQYTRPPEFRGLEAPKVLLSGDHARIEEWRTEQALKRTKERRSDLLD